MTTTALPNNTAVSDFSGQPGQPGQPQQPVYQQGAQPERAKGLAITSLVLGILSVVSSWTFFAPIAGLICGIVALRQQTTERTMALWGVWLNGIMLAFTVLAVTLFIVLLSAGLIGGAFALPWIG